jgi:outer membrane protein, heavy metal efflux system
MFEEEVTMCRRRVSAPAAIVALAIAVTAQAQPAPAMAPPFGQEVAAGPPLALSEALAAARADNPELAERRASVEAARTRPDTERFLPPPMLEAQAWQWPRDTINPANAQLMFMVGQELPGRGKRALRVQLAQREIAVVESAIEIDAVRVAAEVRQSYAELWLARETLAIFDERVRLLRQVADVAELKYATGRIGQQDIVRAVTELTRVREQIVMGREQARMAALRLNLLMGREPHSPIGELDVPAPAASLPPPAALAALARDRQPELAMTAREADMLDAEVAVTRSERRPDFMVQGGYMLMPDMTDAFTARVAISWPGAPWSRRQVDARVREAEARRTLVDARRRTLEAQIAQMVAEAHVRAEAAAERADLIRASVLPQAEHSLEIARVGYQTDRAGFLDLLEAERMLLDMKLELVNAVAARERALSDLDRAIGAPPAGAVWK